MARDTNQLTLSFLDTTSLSAGGLTLDAGYSKPYTPSSPAEPADDDSLSSSLNARNFRSELPSCHDRRLHAAGRPARRQSRQHALGARNRRGNDRTIDAVWYAPDHFTRGQIDEIWNSWPKASTSRSRDTGFTATGQTRFTFVAQFIHFPEGQCVP